VIFGGIFDSPFGYIADPQQQRALSFAEIAAMQAARANLALQVQAKPSMASMRLLVNFRRPPQRPLDERFADFKVRLAAAIERRRK